MRHTIYLFLILIFALTSCKEQNEDISIIPEDRMTEFYVKLSVLKEKATLMALTPEQAERMEDSLYQTEHITETEVQQALDYYKKDIQRWKAFHEKVTARLEALHKEAVDNKAKRK